MQNGLPMKPALLLRDAGLVRVLDDLQGRLDTALETGPRAVVVDISAIGQVSSTTIAALLWIKRRCSARGVQVLLRGPSRRSRDTLQRVGLLAPFPLESVPSRSGGSSGAVFREVPR